MLSNQNCFTNFFQSIVDYFFPKPPPPIPPDVFLYDMMDYLKHPEYETNLYKPDPTIL